MHTASNQLTSLLQSPDCPDTLAHRLSAIIVMVRDLETRHNTTKTELESLRLEKTERRVEALNADDLAARGARACESIMVFLLRNPQSSAEEVGSGTLMSTPLTVLRLVELLQRSPALVTTESEMRVGFGWGGDLRQWSLTIDGLRFLEDRGLLPA